MTFTVTNTGDYTDSFALAVSGVWTATLPGGREHRASGCGSEHHRHRAGDRSGRGGRW